MRAPAGEQPEAEMIAAAEAVARFIETGDGAFLDRAFGQGEATIVENFAPFLFEGPGAVEIWAEAMRGHVRDLSDLSHRFGPAFDFVRAGERVSFSLPTTWRGVAGGKAFIETGGWAFVLARESGAWRVRAYGWAVTRLSTAAPAPGRP
ncbi:MAG: hypothetical protein ACYC8V_03330 [Caulobacteraceae bacterium]